MIHGLLATLLLVQGGPAAPAHDTTTLVPGSEFEISVITAGVGAQVWEKWGHNMLRVRNTVTGEDVAYNWGMFSFQQDGFVRRFLMGRMEYWMQGIPMGVVMRQYRGADRTLVEQHLALSPTQRRALVDSLEWNAREESKYYRYDYYNDNCSTRLRDALDRALGGQLRAATAGEMTETTFRQETRRLSVGDLPLYTGLMLGLGPATDRPISQWDEMFLPVRMMERLDGIWLHGGGMQGDSAITFSDRRLVDRTDTLYLSGRYSEPVGGAKQFPLFLGLGLAIGGLLFFLGWAKLRTPFLLLGALVALLVGLGGALLVFLMGFTDHSVTYGNENALLLSFLTLFLAVVLRPALQGSPRAERLATALAIAIAGLALTALVIKLFPFAIQDDWEMIALFLPIDLGLAVGTLLAIGGPRWRPPRG